MNFHIRHFLTGIAIYAAGSLAGQALYAFGVYDEWTIMGATLSVLALFALFASLDIHSRSIRDILPYSISWALIAIFLDAMLIVPAVGWEFLIAPDALVGYATIALAPLLPLIFRSGASAAPMQSLKSPGSM